MDLPSQLLPIPPIPYNPPIQLTQQQIDIVQGYLDSQNYPAMYTAIAGFIKGVADPDTNAWYGNAGSINSSTPTLTGWLVRNYTADVVEAKTGTSIDPYGWQIQQVSNNLANAVGKSIVGDGVVQPAFSTDPITGQVSGVAINDTQNTVQTLSKLIPNGQALDNTAWAGYGDAISPPYLSLFSLPVQHYLSQKLTPGQTLIVLENSLKALVQTDSIYMGEGSQSSVGDPSGAAPTQADPNTQTSDDIQTIVVTAQRMSLLDKLWFDIENAFQPEESEGTPDTQAGSNFNPSVAPLRPEDVSLQFVDIPSLESADVDISDNILFNSGDDDDASNADDDSGSSSGSSSYDFGGGAGSPTAITWLVGPVYQDIGDDIRDSEFFIPTIFAVDDGDSGGGLQFSGGGGGGPVAHPYVLPIILDLTGNGIKITPLDSSNTFLNIAGDGYEHRTAWAGTGNGVLLYDPTGSSTITQQMVDFTSWDPTATSDMQALKDVFDTNQDGQLDAGDSEWNNFRVLVTNANGTTSLETLQQLGITSINLTSNKQSQSFDDGSRINGETTYTANGQIRTAADVSLAYDSNGYVTSQTVTLNGNGSTTIVVTTYNPDGSIAGSISKTTSANGGQITLTTSNGAGIVEQTQTDTIVTNGDGSKTETLTDADGAGTLTDETVTTTSANGLSVTIDRYLNGGGILNQAETLVTSTSGSLVDTLSDLNPDGSLRDQTVITTTANGLSKTTQVDNAGNGTFDQVIQDNTVVNSDNSRTETASVISANGALESQTITTTSATGASKVIKIDSTGNGIFDLTTDQTIFVNSDASSGTIQTDFNADGSMRDQTVTSISADGLSQTMQIDHTGNGVFDLTTSTVTTDNSDGSTTKTVTDTSANGALLDETVTTVSATGQAETIDTDSNGALGSNGTPFWNRIETIAANAAGSTVDTVSQYASSGALTGQTITTTGANGLNKTIQNDFTGNGTIDLTTTDQTVANSDGSQTETVADYSANNTLLDQTTTTTSANGALLDQVVMTPSVNQNTVTKQTSIAGILAQSENDVRLSRAA